MAALGNKQTMALRKTHDARKDCSDYLDLEHALSSKVHFVQRKTNKQAKEHSYG
ncbi:hypothetical protein [uncultured Senegalimassilia sp.]|uniref:hypothetical protein n=1 Tax=uncultured Senegalimassilia sp. TaxID=1714350 RepID=UPI00267667D1|nr:hypothetical protein [uncultured Senegalimassilia sp.]